MVTVSLLIGYVGYYFNRSNLSVALGPIEDDNEDISEDDFALMLRSAQSSVHVLAHAT